MPIYQTNSKLTNVRGKYYDAYSEGHNLVRPLGW